MNKKILKTIQSDLKQAGFIDMGYTPCWRKSGEIAFVFQYWPSGFNGNDMACKMQAWTGHNELKLSEVAFYLTDAGVSELKPDWLVAHMQELAKKAYDILTAKAMAAAEIAMMGA